MTTTNLKFDLLALAEPKSRQDCVALAKQIIAELDLIAQHIDMAIARCESQRAASLA